jgi:hypothetical protein
MRPDNCPLCDASLIGDPIPQELRDGGGYGDSTHWRREIGYSACDYIQFWICPDCGGTWNRWEPEDPYFDRAERMRLDYECQHTDDRCCMKHQHHVDPHQGCVLR